MDIIINLLVVLATLTILYFAYFRKSEIGKLSIYVIFASVLLKELLSLLSQIALFDLIKDILASITPFITYGEIILLVILFVMRIKSPTNKYFKVSLIVLIILKIIAVIGFF